MYRRLSMMVGWLTLASFGCASPSSTTVNQEGRISLAVTNAPPDATCIQVVVQGTRTVERDVDVAAGASTVLLLEGLPEGTDTITVNAFGGSCMALTPASVPTWIGDPVVALVGRDPIDVTVTLHHNDQNGRVNLGVNFDHEAGSTLDAGTADTSASDATTPDATTPDAVAIDAAPDSAGPNVKCDTCELAQCPDYRTFCDAFAGSDHDKCVAVLACARRTSCHLNNTLDCYCGTADATQCLATTGDVVANGACKAEIEAGQGTTSPTAIQNQYTDVTFPAGAAMSLLLCDNAVCNADCIPY
jgi:hypothetical protein